MGLNEVVLSEAHLLAYGLGQVWLRSNHSVVAKLGHRLDLLGHVVYLLGLAHLLSGWIPVDLAVSRVKDLAVVRYHLIAR